MKKMLSSLVAILLGLTGVTYLSIAEENNASKEDILAACTAESKGAIDAQEYIEECIKEKEEELKALAKDAESSKEKS